MEGGRRFVFVPYRQLRLRRACSKHLTGSYNSRVILSDYFVLLFVLARNMNDPKLGRGIKNNDVQGVDSSAGDVVLNLEPEIIPEGDAGEGSLTKISMEEAGIALTISACICFLGNKVARYLPIQVGIIPKVTAIAPTLSTLLPGIFGKLSKLGNSIGIFSCRYSWQRWVHPVARLSRL